MRTTKNCAEKIQEPHETHQCDHVEAANYLRGAADVLESRVQARGAWKKDVVEFKMRDAALGIFRLVRTPGSTGR